MVTSSADTLLPDELYLSDQNTQRSKCYISMVLSLWFAVVERDVVGRKHGST